MYLLVVAAICLLGVVVQFFTGEVYLRLWGVFGTSIHKEESPGIYWSVMVVETFLGVLCLYLAFA